jgi:3-methyladenine DNA glycosylase/8-oxoguanine DNA glycosylase
MAANHLTATEDLVQRDPVLADLVERHGPMRIGAAPPVAKRFETLANAIASQQLNGRAAQTIWGRVRGKVEGPFTAEAVLAVAESSWRDAGLSGAKAASLIDLAEHVADGRIQLERVGRMSDSEVVSHLTAVRGIGPWTAQMFLMFSLRRLDVWPTGDYGVRIGYGKAFRRGVTPTAKELEPLGDRFRPYRSVVAWYCWAAADDPEFSA